MSVTYGFYNSIDGDRKYSAIEFSRLFEGVFTDGVFRTIGDSLRVTANGENMFVNVGTGRAWFNNRWTDNDSALEIEVVQSELILNRIDAIVLEIATGADRRENLIKYIQGSPASSPVAPDLINTTNIHQYPLAYISVNAGVTFIDEGDIDDRVGTEDCPYLVTITDVNVVPVSRKINDQTLDKDITLTAEDLNAVPTSRTVNSKALSNDISLTASDVSAVPTTRKINNKALSTDISLGASDVGAATAAVSATIGTTWAGTGPYTQTVEVLGMTASKNGSVGIASSASATEREAARAAMLNVTGQTTNAITITADGEKPTVSIPITVILMP